jgi:hypothetical protein
MHMLVRTPMVVSIVVIVVLIMLQLRPVLESICVTLVRPIGFLKSTKGDLINEKCEPTLKNVRQSIIDYHHVVRGLHRLLPFLHLTICQQTTVEFGRETFDVKLLADKHNLLTSIAPGFGKIRKDASPGCFIGWPLGFETVAYQHVGQNITYEMTLLESVE